MSVEQQKNPVLLKPGYRPSEDIDHLFLKLNANSQVYQEVHFDESLDQIKRRWPLLSDIHASEPLIDKV